MSDLRETIIGFVDKIFDIIGEKDEQEKKNSKSIDDIKTTLGNLELYVADNRQMLDMIFSYLKEETKNSSKEKEEAFLDLNSKSKEFESLHGSHEDLKTRYNKLEEEKSNLTNEVNIIKEERNLLNSSIDTKKATINELSNKCSSLENEKANLETEIKETKDSLSQKSSQLDEKKREITSLKPFEEVFKSEKIMSLLNALLNNKALEEYRKREEIVDDTPQSIHNLLKKLENGKSFVNSYYDLLVEYKKNNQEEMSDKEVNFYVKINEYFEKQIIKNPKTKKVDGDGVFSKVDHRGINGDISGVIDNKIILIPSDDVGNDKIKVKVKQ